MSAQAAYWISFDASPGGCSRSENGRIMAFTIGKVLDEWNTQWIVEESSLRPASLDEFLEDILGEGSVLVQYTAGDHPGTWSVGHLGEVSEIQSLLRWVARKGLTAGSLDLWLPCENPFLSAATLPIDLGPELHRVFGAVKASFNQFLEDGLSAPLMTELESAWEMAFLDPYLAVEVDGTPIAFEASPFGNEVFGSSGTLHCSIAGYDPKRLLNLIPRLRAASQRPLSWRRFYQIYLQDRFPPRLDPLFLIPSWEDNTESEWEERLSSIRQKINRSSGA